jgi:hypothetical protein
MIGQVLDDRPHLARSACLPGRDAVATVLELLGHLIAERFPVDLGPLYGRASRAVAHAREPRPATPDPRMLTVPVGGRPFDVKRPAARPVGPAVPAVPARTSAGAAGPTMTLQARISLTTFPETSVSRKLRPL